MDNFDKMADLAVRNYDHFIYSHTSADTAPSYTVSTTDDTYSRYDVIQTRTTPYQTTTDVVELKGRYIPHYIFPDCEIDQDKILALQRIGRQWQKPIWVCALYYLSDKVMIWKIDPFRNYDYKWRLANKKTADLNGLKEWKKVVPLDYSDANIYHYTYTPTDKEIARQYANEIYGSK